MKLKVGLIGNSYGWVQILQQIGVDFELLRDVSQNILAQYPVVILSDTIERYNFSVVRKYLETGGSLLCSTRIFSDITQKNFYEAYAKYLIPDKNGYFNDFALIDLRIKVQYLDYAQHLKTDSGKYTLTATNYGDGNVVLLPFDPGKLYEDTSYQRKTFYTIKNRLPHERVSKISKGPVRRIVKNSLEYLFHSQNLFFCHKSYYPRDTSNIFLFRVDTDYGDIKNVKGLYELAEQHNIPITWFIDVKSQRENLSYYKEMKNQEIAVHCYDHKEIKNSAELKKDLEIAIKILNKFEISPYGYAAVYGRWNSEIAKTIKNFSFQYSSEFSYDYDNLPSFDVYGNLQIPIHPICVGSLKRQGYTVADMIEYFDDEIQRKISINEPLVFYHHPNDDNIEVIHYIFNKVKNLNIPALTFGNFSEWWRKRLELKFSASIEDPCFTINFEEKDHNIDIMVTNKDNQETIINGAGSYSFDSIKWKPKKLPDELPKDIKKIYKFNIWKIINKIEDYI